MSLCAESHSHYLSFVPICTYHDKKIDLPKMVPPETYFTPKYKLPQPKFGLLLKKVNQYRLLQNLDSINVCGRYLNIVSEEAVIWTTVL